MKKILKTLIVVILICCGLNNAPVSGASVTDSLTVLTTPDLKDLVVRWAEDYKKISSGSISVKTVASVTAFPEEGQVMLADQSYFNDIKNEMQLRMVVARNIVVPVISSSNPFLEQIRTTGVSPEEMKMLMKNPELTWGELTGDGKDKTVRLHYVNDRMVIDAMTNLVSVENSMVKGNVHGDAGDMVAAMSSDIYSLGFCRLADIQANETFLSKIAIMPIDKNGNGVMDPNEDIYNDLNAFTRGVWIGKYPKELFSNIMSATATPVPENVTGFLNWIITSGQEDLVREGFSGLILTERISAAGRIYDSQVTPAVSTGNDNIFMTFLLVLVIVLAGVFIPAVVSRLLRKKHAAAISEIPAEGNAVDEKSFLLPKGVYFDKTHTWAFMEQDGLLKIGIDDFLLHMTGQVSKVRMKKAGEKVKRGEEVLTLVRNGKQLRLYSPVTGVIKELNPAIEYNVSVLNSSPYDSGWVYRVEPENWQRENQLLFMSERHRQFIKDEITRIKDMLASLLKNDSPVPVVLQDGGMLREGTLSELSPEVWEEFQNRIIDPSRTVWFYEII